MKLVDFFTELMAYTGLFEKEAGVLQPSYDEVKAKYTALADSSRNAAKSAGLSVESWEKAFFAVCAWADEKILCSDWAEREKWQHSQLQKVHFNTAHAGEDFFSVLDKLETDEKNNQIREVYLYCLSMGFKGMYFLSGDEAVLSGIIKHQKELLRGGNGRSHSPDELVLFPNAYDNNEKKKHKKWYRISIGPFLVVVSIVSAIAFVLLIFMYKGMLNDLVAGYMK